MPSFTRRAAPSSSAPPPGTVPSPGTPLHLLPTGIPSMDDLFAGGIPLSGTWMVLAPDRHSAWGRLVARYWIAQGLCSGQQSIVVGEAETAVELVEGCMWLDPRSAGHVDGAGSESEGEGVGGGLGAGDQGEGKGGKKIAWRYDGMSKFRTTTVGSNHLTLTKTIPPPLLKEMQKSGQLSYIPLPEAGPSRHGNWAMLEGILRDLKSKIAGAKEAVRITICDLGSADWNLSSQEIHRFIHSLRAILRNTTASALITLPAELSQAPKDWAGDQQSWVQSLSWAVDACVELRGFGDSPSLAPLYAPLHGLITLHSFPTSHAILPPTIRHSTLLGISTSASAGGGGGAGENNLGFRCSRKRLEIETVHLGIEGGTGERRTEPVKDVGSVIDTGGPQGQAPGHTHRQAIPESDSGAAPTEAAAAEGVDIPLEKPKKARAKVRFGGAEVQVESAPAAVNHHDHDHDHAPTPPGTRIRHDKPDLYDF